MSQEHLSRIREIIDEDFSGGPWGLSPNDQSALQWALDEIEELKATQRLFDQFASFMATCRRQNTTEWLRLAVDHLNGAAMRLDPDVYFEFDGDGFLMRQCERVVTGDE